jgi:hypothetical protein
MDRSRGLGGIFKRKCSGVSDKEFKEISPWSLVSGADVEDMSSVLQGITRWAGDGFVREKSDAVAPRRGVV